ncbi:hypothetical protein BC830DRAFT_1135715 [Chytriomyces sp. MP71]|nr:hypothetical protein BC830DRAFT_1135715 [Chytriomyces sp. MP71]
MILTSKYEGLLANLWDFPHLPDDTPVSIPDILDHLPGLDELARNHIIVQKHTSVGSVTHLFSHIKLAMTVEWYVCVCVGDASSLPELTGKAEWWTREKMDEGAVPVTLKKALQLVTELAAGGSTGGAGKKRKKVMAEVKGQQSISKFFKVK